MKATRKLSGVVCAMGVMLGVAAGSLAVPNPQKPAPTPQQVKIDNFTFAPGASESARGNYRAVGEPRRYSTHGGQRRQNHLQIQGAGYRRQFFLHLFEARHVFLFLLDPPEDDRESRGGVAGMHVSPFDWRSVLLARHAQHVVLIHFPIALFITGVLFDFLAQRAKWRALARSGLLQLLWRCDFRRAGGRHGVARLAVSA